MYNAALKILKILEENGFESYIVGGYPRDLYLGNKSIDIDICSSATPKDIKAIFDDIKLLNEKYGAVVVKMDGHSFEITTFRKEIKYDNNRIPALFDYVKTLKEDIIRRDFTINTICINYKEEIIDLLNGRVDIDNKIIRSVGNASKKMYEDSLRILRAIRFATTLNFELDDELKEAIKENGYLLKNLSYYRKKSELDRIFSSSNVKRGIELIREFNLDKYLELSNLDKLVITDLSIGIWAQLGVVDIYDFTNIEKNYIVKINEALKTNMDDLTLFYYGLYIGGIAFNIRGYSKTEVTERYEALPIKRRSDIDVEATDICRVLNKDKGSFLREIYEDLAIQIVYRKLNNNKEELLEYIKNNY